MSGDHGLASPIGWIISKQHMRSFETWDGGTCCLKQLAPSIEKLSPIVSQTTNLPSGTCLYCLPWSLPWLSLSFLFFTRPLALICWNDSPRIRGTNRMPSASLSLSSPYPHGTPRFPTPHHHPTLTASSTGLRQGDGGRECSLRSGLMCWLS